MANSSTYTQKLLDISFLKKNEKFEVAIDSDFELIKDSMVIFKKENFAEFKASSSRPNTEFKIDLTYTLNGLTPGAYTMRTILRDKHSTKKTSFDTPVVIQ